MADLVYYCYNCDTYQYYEGPCKNCGMDEGEWVDTEDD